MSADESRAVAHAWASCLNERRIADLAAMGAPDATYFVSGLSGKVPGGGVMPYAQRIPSLEAFFSGMKTLSFKVHSITAEDDRAVIEATIKGQGDSDKIYENHILIKMVVENGKVKQLREFLDFFTVFEYLGLETTISDGAVGSSSVV